MEREIRTEDKEWDRRMGREGQRGTKTSDINQKKKELERLGEK